MTFYRIKDVTTGLYWSPKGYPRWTSTGKIYNSKRNVVSAIRCHTDDCDTQFTRRVLVVEEYAMTLAAVHKIEEITADSDKRREKREASRESKIRKNRIAALKRELQILETEK
jgi:hypothetical protein